jgi:hypothetical protein
MTKLKRPDDFLYCCENCTRLTVGESEALRKDGERWVRERDEQHNRLLARNREYDEVVARSVGLTASGLSLAHQNEVLRVENAALRARLVPWWVRGWRRILGRRTK